MAFEEDFAKNQAEMRVKLAQLKSTEQEAERQKAIQSAKAEMDRTREMSQAELLDLAKTYQEEPDDRDPNKMVTHYAKATAIADSILNKEITSINDWRATMSSTLNMCVAINKAIAGSVYLTYAQYLAPAMQKTFYEFFDKVTGQPKVDISPDTTLPSLIHNISFGVDNDVLKIAPLARSDNAQIQENHRLNVVFRQGIVMWLNEEGWNEDPIEDGVFRDGAGRRLTQEIFEEELHESLEELLSDQDIVYTPAPAPR